MLGEQILQCGPAPPVRPPGGVGAREAQQVEGDEVGGLLRSEPGRARATPLQPALGPLERKPPGLPHDQLPSSAVESGNCRLPDSISGNDATRSVPLRERSMK
ncbi:hypothetical protein [Streptomyces sp. NBC_00076]|uniref:hypothetical protein n=1 Tax=Streptomyces sp. NBC_00076 TaxID=2975642 RepID=UPI003247C4FD